MSIIFLGDFFYQEDKKLSKKLMHKLKSAERVIVNFEAPIRINNVNPVEKVGASLYHEKSVVNFMNELNITDLCLANNHYFDLGYDNAMLSTKYLKDNNYQVHGINELNRNSELNTISNNLVVINVAESEFGVTPMIGDLYGFKSITDPTLYNDIKLSLLKFKNVILVVHAGKENTNRPLPQWKIIYRNLIDLGVLAVIAHHPHVPQTIEKYKGKYIFYSLGNFIMDYISNHKMSKFGILCNLDINADEFKFSYDYIYNNNNEISLLSENQKNTIDYFLEREFLKEPYLDITTYNKIDIRRIIFQNIPRFLESIPFINKRKNRKYDFFLHNSRFETHRYTQELYINKRKSK